MPSTTDAVLLDANVLIALTVADHEHHEASRAWFAGVRRFATCPSTQGSLTRFLLRVASAEHAAEALAILARHPRHEFWADDAPYDAVMLSGVIGHRQVTDAYLAAAAANRGTTLATFDRGLASFRPSATQLIETG